MKGSGKTERMETIIVATDFSDPAGNAARYAAKLAAAVGVSRIVLYHSYDVASVGTEIPVAEQDRALVRQGSLIALELVAREMQLVLEQDSAIGIELVTNELPLMPGVEQLAEQWHAGLVVAGATGKSRLQKFLVGSNAISLASSCPVPLLIVPKECTFEPITKIVFACDLKQVTRSTPVSTIGWWLERLHASLLVLNIVAEGSRFNPDTIPEQYNMHELLDGFGPKYHYIEKDDIVGGIAGFAESEGAGLVIAIPKTYGFFEGLFHRRVSGRLVEKAAVPLLLLKEKQ